ncbi:cellulose synthase complex periplasmic endoglucanase BcsZ [Variovorax sp. W2I14]|uniref:cellulose synthase complex periplasmic endoglucanase BcsZ n=1 Tax=Variovorax sp. W2I14 TaxID=3042290 RepID=UPI003D2169C4
MPPAASPPSIETRIGRRPLLAAAALGWAASRPAFAATPAAACHPASDWAAFAARHIQRDGRVIDFNTPQQQSTSEGQSYSLFFALIHDDKPTFARVLAWTEANLAQGSLASNLPAWQWGKKPDGGWGVLDGNAASDADLWIAYALMEAGRLWNEPRYAKLGRSLLALVVRDEVVALPGLGRMLLPWPASVASDPVWRLNPSYMPLQLLHYFQHADPRGPWREVADNTLRLLDAVAPKGFAPDWCGWSQTANAFVADPEKGTVGSYDAIRVYLWAGMLSPRAPEHKALMQRLNGPRQLLAEHRPMPESVDTATGAGRGTGPLGFTGALLPYLKAQALPDVLATESARLPGGRAEISSAAAPGAPMPPMPYYEQVLSIFGQAWLDGRYEFDRNGQLQTSWRLLCRPARAA